MNTLIYIIIATFLVSLISLIGVITLILKRKILDKILLSLVALSAGALMGGAFFHLIPESIEKTSNMTLTFSFLLAGFCIFLILEFFMLWHHPHSGKHKEVKKPMSYLILISDSIHNFIDGLIIAASFVVSIPLGIITTAIVGLHEIPQEIGDFGVLIFGGFKKSKALLFNFITALTAIIGGIIGYILSGAIGSTIVYLLPFAAGNFIYIAASDLIPELKQRNIKTSLVYFLIFLLGISLTLLIKG